MNLDLRFNLQRLATICVIALGVCLAPTVADATIVLKLDTEALSTRASSIIMGHVESSHASWHDGRIITEFQIRVALPIKGGHQQGALITIQQMGGRVDDLAQVIPGSPNLANGEQVLLFLDNTVAKAKPTILGMSQGKYKIAVGPDKTLWAVRDLTNLSLAVFEETSDGQRKMLLLDEGAVDEAGAIPLSGLLSDIAQGLIKNKLPLDSALRERLTPELTPDSYDFSRDLDAVFPYMMEANSP